MYFEYSEDLKIHKKRKELYFEEKKAKDPKISEIKKVSSENIERTNPGFYKELWKGIISIQAFEGDLNLIAFEKIEVEIVKDRAVFKCDLLEYPKAEFVPDLEDLEIKAEWLAEMSETNLGNTIKELSNKTKINLIPKVMVENHIQKEIQKYRKKNPEEKWDADIERMFREIKLKEIGPIIHQRIAAHHFAKKYNLEVNEADIISAVRDLQGTSYNKSQADRILEDCDFDRRAYKTMQDSVTPRLVSKWILNKKSVK